MNSSFFKNYPPSLFIIAAFGLGLRLIAIGVPLASDELASVSIWAQMPFHEIPFNYQYPNNHIFLTIILSVLLKTFGLNEILLRLPVLICGVASIMLASSLALRLTANLPVALGAGFLLAINANHIFYSTNARGYMLIMVAAQWSILRIWDLLSTPPEDAEAIPVLWPPAANLTGALFLVWFFGTWTLPTFILFEVSLAVFLGVLLIHYLDEKNDHPRISVIRLLILLGAAVVGFYIQYFVFIPQPMRELAMANAAKVEGGRLLPGMMDFWLHPFEEFSYGFSLLALLTLVDLFYRNRQLLLLFVSLLAVPPVLTFMAYLWGSLPVVPAPRVFFYLQPFVFFLVAQGVYRMIGLTLEIFGARYFSQVRRDRIHIIVYTLAFVPMLLMSGPQLRTEMITDRWNREPLDQVNEFINQLGPRDLVLASNSAHVGLFLYGGSAIRERVENIIDAAKVGDIYFVEHIKKGESDVRTFQESGIDWLELSQYFPVSEGNPEEPPHLILPRELFIPPVEVGNFMFHKIDPRFIKIRYALKTPRDLERWEAPGGKQFTVEPFHTPAGTQPVLSVREGFVLVSPLPEPETETLYKLYINLVSTSLQGADPAIYLNGDLQEDRIVYSPAWRGNGWILDHPYGPEIYNRSWRPAIFISGPDASLEVVRVEMGKDEEPGQVRGLLSIELIMTQKDFKLFNEAL